MTRRLGVLGGTFDPVHFGHLDAAAAARSALALHDVLFVPSHDPPHRPADPHATAFQRLALVELAIDGVAAYRVSDVELLRDGRSYTSDTLRALHAAGNWPTTSLSKSQRAALCSPARAAVEHPVAWPTHNTSPIAATLLLVMAVSLRSKRPVSS